MLKSIQDGAEPARAQRAIERRSLDFVHDTLTLASGVKDLAKKGLLRVRSRHPTLLLVRR